MTDPIPVSGSSTDASSSNSWNIPYGSSLSTTVVGYPRGRRQPAQSFISFQSPAYKTGTSQAETTSSHLGPSLDSRQSYLPKKSGF